MARALKLTQKKIEMVAFTVPRTKVTIILHCSLKSAFCFQIIRGHKNDRYSPSIKIDHICHDKRHIRHRPAIIRAVSLRCSVVPRLTHPPRTVLQKLYFQDDLFPPARVTWESTMTANEFFAGEVKPPRVIDLRPDGMEPGR